MMRNAGMSGPPRRASASLVARAVVEMEMALRERQALLGGPDTPPSRAHIDALGLRVADLLEEIAGVHPPRGALQDEAAVPGEFDRFLHGGDAKRRAG